MELISAIRREKTYLKKYFSEAKRVRQECSSKFSLLNAAWFYPTWRKYLEREGHALEHEIPWITFGAIRFLEQTLDRDMSVFEYGSGGSTLFFAQRAGRVVSVEHDAKWARKVEEALAGKGITNCKLHLVEPESGHHVSGKPSDVDSYVSSSERYAGQSFEAYVRTIDDYTDAFFDVILIDGRARPSCFKHALSKVAEGGYLVFDNTDRLHYQPAMEKAPEHYSFFDFPGPSPFLKRYTRTSAWRRMK